MKKVLKFLLILIILFIIGLAGAILIDTNKVLSFKQPVIAVELTKPLETVRKYSAFVYGLEVTSEQVDLYIFGQKVFTNEFKKEPKEIIGTYTFKGKIVEKNGLNLIVTPTDSMYINVLSDKVAITITEDEYVLGEEVYITYDSRVTETYPTQIEARNVKKEKDYYDDVLDLNLDYNYLQAAKDDVFVTVVETYYNTGSDNFNPPYTHMDSAENGMELVEIEHASPNLDLVLPSSERKFNTDEVDKFMENVDNNIPDFIRVINYGGTDKEMDSMAIRDISFEGDNVFKTAYSYIATVENSPNGTKIVYNEYSKMIKVPEHTAAIYSSEVKGFVLSEPKQEEADNSIFEVIYSPDEIINNDYNSNYLIDIIEVKELSSKDILDNNQFILKFDGFEDATIWVENNILSLEKNMKDDPKHIENFYSKILNDFEQGVSFAYIENNVIKYSYDEYYIIVEEMEGKIKITIQAKY